MANAQRRVAELLNMTLAEEEISDNLLTQIARELFTKAPKRADVTGGDA